jgi:hypothetical protein
MNYEELLIAFDLRLVQLEQSIFSSLNDLHHKVKLLMAQIDDLTTALATATADTQKLITDVAAQVAALQAALGQAGQPVDLTAAIAAANNIDALVTAADAATQPPPVASPSAKK